MFLMDEHLLILICNNNPCNVY